MAEPANIRKGPLVYLMELTYGLAAVVAFIVWPILLLAAKIQRWYKGLLTRLPLDRTVQQMSRLDADDPRRKAMEALVRLQRADNYPFSGL